MHPMKHRIPAFATDELAWEITAQTWAGSPIENLEGSFTPKVCFTEQGGTPPVDRDDADWIAATWVGPTTVAIKVGDGGHVLARGFYDAHLVLIGGAVSPGWYAGLVEVY